MQQACTSPRRVGRAELWITNSFPARRSRILYGRRIFPIPEDHGQQLAGFPITRHKFSRVGEATEQPAKKEFIRPHGNANLIASEKAYGCAGAMNTEFKFALAFQHQPKPLLSAATKADHNMFRAALVYEGDQGLVINTAAGVTGSNITIVLGKVAPLRVQPGQILLPGEGAGHDPQN